MFSSTALGVVKSMTTSKPLRFSGVSHAAFGLSRFINAVHAMTALARHLNDQRASLAEAEH